MDKSWINLPRNSPEYVEGLDKFLEYAFSNRSVDGKIICPCPKCGFKKWKTPKVVYEHLIHKSMLVPSPSLVPTPSSVPTPTPIPTFAPLFPTSTPISTAALVPISTPVPTSTPTPAALVPISTPVLTSTPTPAPSVSHQSSTQQSFESDYDSEENEQTEGKIQPSQSATGRRGWCVQVKDRHGTVKEKKLTWRDVWLLHPGERILLQWNDNGQPIGEGGGLLTRFLGHVGRNFEYFPIFYESWRKVPKDYKNKVFKDIIQPKFEVDSSTQKKYVMQSLNTKWREERQALWTKRADKTHNRDRLLAMIPDGINIDHWASFIDYRLDQRTKEKAEKNKESRKKLTMPHTGGSKSIARKRAEMEIERGRKVSRGEVWMVIHKHANGEFVNDEAKEIGEKIETYEASTTPLSQEISTRDSLAYAIGAKEHYGRVRGLGLGPCPTQVFGTTRLYKEELQSEVSVLKSQMDEQKKKLEEQNKKLEEQTTKFNAMMSFFMHNFQGQLPTNLAVLHASKVSDEGSENPTNLVVPQTNSAASE